MKSRAWIRAGSEFVVIVVGVLVALALEDLASDRTDRTSELRYLTSLSDDLRLDSELFGDRLIPRVSDARAAMIEIAPVARGLAPVPADTIRFLRRVIASTSMFSQLGVQTTFDELLATGSLQLVESPELRNAIVGYYGGKTLANRRAAARASGYAALVRGHLPEAATGGLTGSEATLEPEESLRAFGLGQALDAVRSPEFVQAMNRQISLLDLLHPMLTTLSDRVEELMVQVEDEIDRLQ